MMTPDEMIAAIQAHKEGKAIECKKSWQGDNCWFVGHVCWDFNAYDYRVKPETKEPREWWLVKDRDGWFDYKAYSCCQNGAENIHVREVLPEE